MVGREPVLEADLDPAGFAGAGVRKRESLLAPANRAGGFLLVFGVAIPGLGVLLQKQFMVLFVVAAGGFYGGGADFANHNLSAVVVRIGALVGLVRPMLNAENLTATVALEGEEIELVAIGELAVATQIRKSFCSSRHPDRSLIFQFVKFCKETQFVSKRGNLNFIYRGRGVGSGVGLPEKLKPKAMFDPDSIRCRTMLLSSLLQFVVCTRHRKRCHGRKDPRHPPAAAGPSLQKSEDPRRMFFVRIWKFLNYICSLYIVQPKNIVNFFII